MQSLDFEYLGQNGTSQYSFNRFSVVQMSLFCFNNGRSSCAELRTILFVSDATGYSRASAAIHYSNRRQFDEYRAVRFYHRLLFAHHFASRSHDSCTIYLFYFSHLVRLRSRLFEIPSSIE